MVVMWLHKLARRRHLSQEANETALNDNKKVEEKNTMKTFRASQLPMSFIDSYEPNKGTMSQVKNFCLWEQVFYGHH